jgi:hypothetical protein
MEIQQEFQNSNILISRVKENLSSYDNAGIIDEGKFYFLIKEELRLLGEYVYIPKTDVLEIDNNKTALPKDFIQLYSLYNIDACSHTIDVQAALHPKRVYQYYEKDGDCCEHDKVYIVEEKTIIKNEIKVGDKGVLLNYNGRKDTDLCYKDSPNFHCQSIYDFNIDKNYIYTNLSDGSLYLEYLAFPYDEDGLPMIPDETKIEKAIESFIMYKVFEDFWINDVVNNAQNKMQYYKNEYTIHHKEALNYVKLSSFAELTNLAYKKTKRFNKVKQLVYGQ